MEARPYERATDELRAVKRNQRSLQELLTGYAEWLNLSTPDPIIAVQRKWLVQDAESYTSLTPRNPGDVLDPSIQSRFDHASRGGPPCYITAEQMRWYPVREEWRDIPVVTEEETRA